ncbi:sensor domain-containing diguanylate cyclase [Variovorax atrisoli]|uniref:sensor domain-containing diguanylate cyclase n=1 Tax=Variovorax atrisoli TaxID=3394203 RepID=UPI00035FE43B|nr:GGDEF domain-containing protein [Variovorax paradoxus]
MALPATSSGSTPASHSAAGDLDAMFDLAPVSLWIEDYGDLKRKLDGWRAEGVTDLVAHLQADPRRVNECMALLRVLRVNQHTLKLFGADSEQTLLGALDRVFRGDMSATVVHELDQLWRGQLSFESETVNYALDGRRLDVRVRARVLPGYEDSWSRVLVALDDVTERVAAQRLRDESAIYARSLFDRSPVSLWVEDFSAVRSLMETLRARGITDFATFIKVHPDFVTRCMQEIRVIDVNHETLRMFGAPNLQTLLGNLSRIFRDEMRESFAEQLQDLWNGKTVQHREVLNYSLSGEVLNIHMQFAVQDDRLDTWDLVLVSLVDITARKKAEAYLEYLGKHDVLTQLCNRTYYTEELNRLSRKGPWPVSIVAIDLNGLKQVNDLEGHAAGDTLLRRMGEVLDKAVDLPAWPARIGGDEFAVLLPMTDERGAEAMRERILTLLEMNNQFHAGQSGHALSLAIGLATCHGDEPLEAALQRADRAMYEDKSRYYQTTQADRRAS